MIHHRVKEIHLNGRLKKKKDGMSEMWWILIFYGLYWLAGLFSARAEREDL